MSPSAQMEKPPSLAQLFEPPEGYVGAFGWICGYTADPPFLNEGVERFTHQTRAQRAHMGTTSLVLLADPSCPQIRPVDVPGALHLPMLRPAQRPFRLMHAKVALLAYRGEEDRELAAVRLVVSTGNWTQGTLRESLDLAYRVDVRSGEFSSGDEQARQARTDVAAAWDMMRWLRDLFDLRILTTLPPGSSGTPTHDGYLGFEELLAQVRPGKGVVPRFIDNRRAPFLRQVPDRVSRSGSGVACNYLAMGSGFYQAAGDGSGIPSVLTDIVATLQAERLVTRTGDVDVFVNPEGCQAVAGARAAMEERGWCVRPARKPGFFGAGESRSLHAKFLLAANERANSNTCNSAWVYLGSGNLTEPGFRSKMSPHGGNLEAGVVLIPEALYWCEGRNVPPELVVTNLLPIGWDEVVDEDQSLAAGPEFTPPETEFVAPPVPCLWWVEDAAMRRLEVLDPNADNRGFEVMSFEGNPCSRWGDRGFVWTGDMPRQVRVRWRDERDGECTATVPVVDPFGRVAAAPLQAIGLEEAWGQLDNFPMPPEDEDLAEAESRADSGPAPGDVGAGSGSADYPVRRMMQLVENIAAKQTRVAPHDWRTWCNRLEQVLVQAAYCGTPSVFVELGLNPLSPLRAKPFRPEFAETDEVPAGQAHKHALDRVEREWQVTWLTPLGMD